MPRLNYGTLLENLVVLEATRLCLKNTEASDSLAFASSFAMPPLTQTWSKGNEATSCTSFSDAFLREISQRQLPEGSLQSFLSLCRTNAPGLPVCRYTKQEAGVARHPTGGPNGALLTAMLAIEQDRICHLWLNDDGGRYGEPFPGTPNSMSEASKTNDHAGTLLGKPVRSSPTYTPGLFPGSIKNLKNWLISKPVSSCPTRLGFLDPDDYMQGDAQVSRLGHQEWLQALASDCEKVISVMFFSCRGPGTSFPYLKDRISYFHEDAVGLYPRSVVFRLSERPILGNPLVGVKIRWPEPLIDQAVSELTLAIGTALYEWGGFPTPLLCYHDGSPR